jgi:hypothetical protein
MFVENKLLYYRASEFHPKVGPKKSVCFESRLSEYDIEEKVRVEPHHFHLH